jgi:hypothetical protein
MDLLRNKGAANAIAAPIKLHHQLRLINYKTKSAPTNEVTPVS